MRTFNEYVNQKELMSYLTDAMNSIREEAENNSEFKKLLIDEGFWGNLGQGVMAGAKALWSGGMKNVGAAVKDAVAGQKAYYDGVMTNLQKLIKVVPSAAQTTGKGQPEAQQMQDWLTTIYNNLKTQETQFKYAQQQAGQVNTNVSDPNAGVKP
jgi:hypothetical protein